MFASNSRRIVWLLCLPALLNGCATSALWQEGQFASFHEPATPSNLALYHSAAKRKVLVAYDESNEKNDKICKRLYWINLDQKPFKNPHKPTFVRDGKQKKLAPISIVSAPVTQPTSSVYAVGENNQAFTLVTPTGKYGVFELPVYKDASGRTKQVLLTPVTVVADVTVVGGVLFLWCWSEGGLEGVH